MSLEKMCCKKCGAELVEGTEACPNCGYSEKPVEPKLSIRQRLYNLWKKNILDFMDVAYCHCIPSTR